MGGIIVFPESETRSSSGATRVLDWDNGVSVSTTSYGEAQNLLNYQIPAGTFTKPGQALEIDVWGTLNTTGVNDFIMFMNNHDISESTLGGAQSNKKFNYKIIIKAISNEAITFNFLSVLNVVSSSFVNSYRLYTDSAIVEPIAGAHTIRFAVWINDGSCVKEGHIIKFIDS